MNSKQKTQLPRRVAEFFGGFKKFITSYFLFITFQSPKDFLGKSEEVIGKK